jgi:hypothetical protein
VIEVKPDARGVVSGSGCWEVASMAMEQCHPSQPALAVHQ